MLKYLFQIALCLAFSDSMAQQWHFSGGMQLNSFYAFHASDGPTPDQFQSGWGYAFEVGVDNLVFGDFFPLMFTLSLEEYGGNIEVKGGGLGSGYTDRVKTSKTTLNLGLYPVNFSIKKRLKVALGVDLAALLGSSSTTNNSSWHGNSPTNFEAINDQDLHYPLYLGLNARVHWPIEIAEGWFLAPTYRFRWGVSREFTGLHDDLGTKRHYFQVTLSRAFSNNKRKD